MLSLLARALLLALAGLVLLFTALPQQVLAQPASDLEREIVLYDDPIDDPDLGPLEVVQGEIVVNISAMTPLAFDALRNELIQRLHLSLLVPVADGTFLRLRSETLTIDQMINIVRNNDQFRELSAQPNYVYRFQGTPNDPRFNEQWALHNIGQTIMGTVVGQPDADIDAPEAWTIRHDSEDVLVAVIDTGVEYGHDDLDEAVWRAPQAFDLDLPYVGAFPLSPQQIRCNANDRGLNVLDMNCDPSDLNGHGTNVAGVIGARGDNHWGVAGVSWRAKILPVRAGTIDGGITATDGATAIFMILLLMDEGLGNVARVRIINASWGAGGPSDVLEGAIQQAADQDILFVAAAGNGPDDIDALKPFYPASYNIDNIISVAASDHLDLLTYISNFGVNAVDVAAPGYLILTTDVGNSFGKYSGTSLAAPHIAGAAALLLAMCEMSSLQLKQTLLRTSDSLASLQTKVGGGRRLNLETALRSVAVGTVEDASCPPHASAVEER